MTSKSVKTRRNKHKKGVYLDRNSRSQIKPLHITSSKNKNKNTTLTDLLESEEIPRAFSKEVLYFSIRREKSLYLLSTAVTHFLISAAWACPFSQKPSASCINNFTRSLVCYRIHERWEGGKKSGQSVPLMNNSLFTL